MSLWRHREFLKLWSGQSISAFGSQVTELALPLTAALTLHVNPFEMGVLSACLMLPFLLLSLPAGVWIDHLPRRRPVVIAADVGRALLLATIPAAALFNHLSLRLLYAVAFGHGIFTLVFRLAYWAYLPTLLEREQLTEANSRLLTSESAAQLMGPALAGGLVQLLSAPLAIAADALSFLISAASVALIRRPEPPLQRPELQKPLQDLAGGFLVLRDPTMRTIVGSATTLNFFGAGALAILVLFAVRDLGLSPTLLGLALSAASVGALIGALVAPVAARRLGQGNAVIAAAVLFPVYLLLLPLAGGPSLMAMSFLAGAGFVGGLGVMVFDVNVGALRQAITPTHLMGRTSAVMQFITQGAKPLGALLGGALGQALGLRPTLWAMGVGGLTILLWVWFSPLRRKSARLLPNP